MGSQVVSNGVSGITPTKWSEMVQIPLYKSLVAMEVANVQDVQGFNAINIPRFASLSTTVYTPGTPLSATNQQWNYDTLNVSTYRHSSVYIDDLQKAQINVDQWRELAQEEAFQIRNKIDSFVFGKITGSGGFTSVGVDAATVQGGTAHRPISAGSGAIIQTFGNLRKILRQANVEEMGDWCAVVTPLIAASIEIKAASSGFNVADATLRNGYAGNFMGFDIYISNNLPSGKCSTVAVNISGAAVSATNCRSMYVGRKGMINLYMKAPQLSIRPLGDKIGSNYVTYVYYGGGITTKNKRTI